MPTYAYRCEACDFEFEKFQAITANALRKCPECGKLKLRRLLGTGTGILFKGGGFYETDYRNESYKEAAKKDKPATDKTDKKSLQRRKTLRINQRQIRRTRRKPLELCSHLHSGVSLHNNKQAGTFGCQPVCR